MKNLSIPFVYQYNKNSCGAAALEMVYKYFRLKDISQEDIFEKYKKLEPHESGNYYITVKDLILDAKSKDFHTKLYRINYSSIQSLSLLKEILDKSVPIIVCQQYTKEKPLIGHFRVVVGINDKFVFFHDPSQKVGGENLKWSYQEFLDYWQPTGKNVSGGIFFILFKDDNSFNFSKDDARLMPLKKEVVVVSD